MTSQTPDPITPERDTRRSKLRAEHEEALALHGPMCRASDGQWECPTAHPITPEHTAEDFAAVLRDESVRRVSDRYVHHAVIRNQMREMADRIVRWERGEFHPATPERVTLTEAEQDSLVLLCGWKDTTIMPAVNALFAAAVSDRLRAAGEREAQIRALLREPTEGMVHHGRTGHSSGLICDECPDYPHTYCVPMPQLRALLDGDESETP